MVAGPRPFFRSNPVTIQVGVPPAVAASASAAVDRSARVSLNVRLVPLSPAETSSISMAGWLALATGTTGNLASPAGSVDQLPGGRPCVPAMDKDAPLEAEVIATLAGVGSGSRLPLAAKRLG